MGNRHPTNYSKCFDCGNATNPDACPWVRDFTPVPGWEADETTVGRTHTFQSFRVRECPLFWRDAHKAGLEEDVFGRKRHVTIDGEDTVKLASAICTRAVEDWKFLQYGALQSIPYYGDRIYRDEIIEFFFSEWFTRLLGCFSQRTPAQIRKAIGITEDMRPEVKSNHRYDR